MPLPQALAARLAKRGIIKLAESEKTTETTSVQEEIIAEDYDDVSQNQENIPVPPPPEKFDKFQGWFSCPNKWNVYHECSPFCQKYWQNIKGLDEEYIEKKRAMLDKYPLPPHWKEVLDIGLGRHYYWNMETNLVSWFAPGHPRCRVSIAAAILRKEMSEAKEKRLMEEVKPPSDEESEAEEEEEKEPEEEIEEERERKKRRRRRSGSKEREKPMDVDERVEPPKEPRDKRSSRDGKSDSRRRREERKPKEERPRKGRKQEEDDGLDPMDPAAYSECPRGTWATGLPDKNEAKTGVDSTASGPLFQMRPYPNPGAILRANAASGIGPNKPSEK